MFPDTVITEADLAGDISLLRAAAPRPRGERSRRDQFWDYHRLQAERRSFRRATRAAACAIADISPAQACTVSYRGVLRPALPRFRPLH